MNKKIYRQYDSRWGNLPYPSKPYTLNRSGCGCVAVTHCAIERDKYKNYTPKDVRKFMVKYATRGHGTEWAGIKKGLEHYGYNVHWVKREDPMSDVWKHLKGSLNRGVILFGSTKGADGTVWTTDGHFIAFTAYKIEKGKHWFYLKDSGGRKHDGWYCYEKSMKGDVRQVWICTSIKDTTVKPITKPKTKYTGAIPKPKLKKGSKGGSVLLLQKFLNWYHPAWNLKPDGYWGKKTDAAFIAWQKVEKLTPDGVFGKKSYARALTYKAKTTATTKKTTTSTKTSKAVGTATKIKTTSAQKLLAKMKELAWAYGTKKSKYAYKTGAPKAVCKKAMKKYGWADNKAEMSDCGNFVSTVVRESGVSKTFKALHGTKTPFPKSEKGFNIVLKGKKIPNGFLKAGDIVRYKKKNGNQHVLFYYGDGKICEASHHNRFGAIIKDPKKYNNSSIAKISTVQVLRAK